MFFVWYTFTMNNREEYKRSWYLKNKERILEKAKLRYEGNKQGHLEYCKIWARNNPEKISAIGKRYRAKNKQKRNEREAIYRKSPIYIKKQTARMAVYVAIKCGKLIKPVKCSMCLSPSKLEAHHHKGYSKDHHLDVIWLCNTCHNIVHVN